MRRSALALCAVLSSFAGTLAAQTSVDPTELIVKEPLTAAERSAAVRLTRECAARIWWNKTNRVVGLSLKGADANDRSLAFARDLPGIRTVVLVASPQNQLSNEGLAQLTNLPNLTLLSISGNRITDGGMIHVGQMRGLRTLVLNCNVTDAGLEMLSELTNLEQLDLTQSKITDAGVAQLRNFPKLETLILNGTQITNESLPTLVELKALQQLYLGNTAIDDGAVESLKQMEQLSLLLLLDTRVTAHAITQLQPFFSAESSRIIHQSGTYPGTRKSPLAMARIARPSAESLLAE
ncbi:MAG: leucine-rich repeat domain-containing protein [Pirellulaceae bacterium]